MTPLKQVNDITIGVGDRSLNSLGGTWNKKSWHKWQALEIEQCEDNLFRSLASLLGITLITTRSIRKNPGNFSTRSELTVRSHSLARARYPFLLANSDTAVVLHVTHLVIAHYTLLRVGNTVAVGIRGRRWFCSSWGNKESEPSSKPTFTCQGSCEQSGIQALRQLGTAVYWAHTLFPFACFFPFLPLEIFILLHPGYPRYLFNWVS